MIKDRDYCITFVRLIATTMIVICHFLQFYNCELAWWLNAGVPVFLCMSGYLYGKKLVPQDDEITFFRKQAVKILSDYYIVVIPVMLLQAVLIPGSLSPATVFQALTLLTVIAGGGHLWFVPCILLCYFLTPFLIRTFYRCRKDSSLALWLLSLLGLTYAASPLYFSSISPFVIYCYILGLFLGFCEKTGRTHLFRQILWIVSVFCIASNGVQIYVDYISHTDLTGQAESAYSVFSGYAHISLGICLFFALRFLLQKFLLRNACPGWLQKIGDLSDRYSYDVYLVHHFLILGPMTLMHMALPRTVIILATTILILIGAWIAGRIAAPVRRTILQKTGKRSECSHLI